MLLLHEENLSLQIYIYSRTLNILSTNQGTYLHPLTTDKHLLILGTLTYFYRILLLEFL